MIEPDTYDYESYKAFVLSLLTAEIARADLHKDLNREQIDATMKQLRGNLAWAFDIAEKYWPNEEAT